MNRFAILTMFCMIWFAIFQLSASNTMPGYTRKGVNHGAQIYGKETVHEIQANGFVTLGGTKVTYQLQVNGHLKAEDAQIKAMQVNGQAMLNHCVLEQRSIVCGVLLATSSRFMDELSVSSERVFFDSCELNSLRVLQVGGYQGVQVVELKGKTKIHGSIVFESGNGEIIVNSDSEIIGNIVGGKFRKQ